MKKSQLLHVFCVVSLPFFLLAQNSRTLPLFSPGTECETDWLVSKPEAKAGAFISHDERDIILWNGLVRRTFRVGANLACFDYRNLCSGEQLLRAIKPEARIVLKGKSYNIGGLYGQKQQGYLLPEWVDGLAGKPEDFQLASYEVKKLSPRINWKRNRWSSSQLDATGIELVFQFEHASAALEGLKVFVHYEMYDYLPVICKWVSVVNENPSGESYQIDRLVNEILAAHEEESAVVGRPDRMKKPHGIYVESNYCYNNAMRAELSDQSTHWIIDSTYTSQVNYDYNTPCVLEVYPAIGPGETLRRGDTLESIRTWELLLDSYDRERSGLARRRMYRAIAPWATQNPIFMHLTTTDPAVVRKAVDQCAETGYEMVILSFGSGLNMEDTSETNILKFRELADYAHSKGVGLGGYSLFSSRRISDEDDVIDPVTGLPDKGAFFGNAPCMGSKWGLAYLASLRKFFEGTGFDIFENDGPYPGDVCASGTHPGHKGLEDSQWRQMELQKGLYRWMNERGIYINAPDWYFLDGTHKIAMGYRETNFSLPREEQVVMNRQHVYDGTWEKAPSMGWMFVPLTQYHGGGEAATIEPLEEHLDVYRTLMMQNYGAGAQACYRGPRLYDTDKTKEMVTSVVSWYKRYREILNSDVIHLRRPDGRDWDGIMHVNPGLKEKGFVLLFNPLKENITRQLKLPVYYTGLHKSVSVTDEKGRKMTCEVSRDYEINIEVTIPAQGMRWLLMD